MIWERYSEVAPRCSLCGGSKVWLQVIQDKNPAYDKNYLCISCCEVINDFYTHDDKKTGYREAVYKTVNLDAGSEEAKIGKEDKELYEKERGDF